MSNTELRYLGLMSGHSDGAGVRIQLVTQGGAVRTAPLTRQHLLKIIQSAARAIEYLDRKNGDG
jgi:hypothetical protein